MQRLVPGSLVLGQVAEINLNDITVSLPNNLTGYVPITSISDKVLRRIEAVTASESRDKDLAEDQEDLDLNQLFFLGQYLRVLVTSTNDETNTTSSGKAKRRIELSVRPQQSNNGLTPQNVIVNSTLMASVISVEDHGLVMDIGLPDSGLRGFMPSKDIDRSLELSSIQEGAVFLCTVTGLSSNGKIVKLSANTQETANPKTLGHLIDAPTIDALLPGTAVEILVADITSRGIVGKAMGMMNVTADLLHSGAATGGKELEKKYKIGLKVMCRIICTFPTADPPKLGVSLLDHCMSLTTQHTTTNGRKTRPLEALPLSATVDEVIVRKVDPGLGLFVDVGVKSISGFIHISRVKDGRVDVLSESSGPFMIGTTHRGRVIGYNSMDGVYILSLQHSVLAQPFIRLEDLKVGAVVQGKVEKIVVNARGVGGLLVNLAEGISGLVPEAHMADVQLLHPEKKFKEGASVMARVLYTDPNRRQIRLTLKKSLVNSDSAPFISYEKIHIGMQSPGTIINILSTGAVVQFYGTIRGFLPVAEMSEAYIQDPNEHFRVGQVVNVHVLKVDVAEQKLVVSCKDQSVHGLAQQNALKRLQVGDIVSAQVTAKSNDDISVDLQDLDLHAILPIGHLTDGSHSKTQSALKRIRIGQTLTDLVVLEKLESKHLVVLTNKPSLVKDTVARTLLRSFEDVKENKIVHGFVKNITLSAVFVQFGGGLTGLLPKSKLSEETRNIPDFGMRRFQSVQVKVTSINHDQRRFVLSMVDVDTQTEISSAAALAPVNENVLNPVDNTITSVNDFELGKLTKAKVVSVKDTQLNVQLAENVQGRIDVSQIFDSWEEIKDRKRPLRAFSAKQVIDVRILGVHDARNHRFLPITHRSGRTLVFELSAKRSDREEVVRNPLTLDKIKVGSSWVVFVNNVGDDCIWVNLSPNIRGRITALDISDDVSLLSNLESSFPIGSAIRAHVTAVDVSNNRLDLSARSVRTSEVSNWGNLSRGMVLPGKVTRVNERTLMVQLSDSIAGPIGLTDLADDFSEADTAKFSKNEIIRVCVTDIDAPNKKIRLSARPSRVLDSSSTVKDPELSHLSQLKVNDIVRGFINNISEKGLFISLGGHLTAFVRVSDISDSYIKDWKTAIHVDQLVEGKVISIDQGLGHIQMSLKASVINKNYVAPLNFQDLKVSKIVTGKIRKVEDFGVFIVVDGSNNVSGLCHQSEMAEKRVNNVKALYDEGDSVKAIVLKIESEKRRVSFGLKASYFEDGAESEDDDKSDDSESQGVHLRETGLEEDDSSDNDSSGIDLGGVENANDIAKAKTSQLDEEMEEFSPDTGVPALSAGGFDWTADLLNRGDGDSIAGSDADEQLSKKKKRRKAEIKVDRTGDLDASGPQSVSDFERLLLGQPDSSELWIQYMAFQVQLGELGKARDIAERAIKTINIREETEKLNVWIALLNLEVSYGSDDTVEEVFKRACQYNDTQEIHERLVSIYIQSGKNDVSLSLSTT
jgi:rRNA biogenesis protein RRP5